MASGPLFRAITKEQAPDADAKGTLTAFWNKKTQQKEDPEEINLADLSEAEAEPMEEAPLSDLEVEHVTPEAGAAVACDPAAEEDIPAEQAAPEAPQAEEETVAAVLEEPAPASEQTQEKVRHRNVAALFCSAPPKNPHSDKPPRIFRRPRRSGSAPTRLQSR